MEEKMVKRVLLILVLAAAVAGGVFAQTGFASMPKNTVTVDVGPAIVGVAFGQVGKIAGSMMENAPDFNSSGFGIAAQYERQLLSQLSVAARGAYLGVGLKGDDIMGAGISGQLDLTTFSLEGHVRFYPFGQTFFLGAMAGYGNLAMDASGRIEVTGQREESLLFNASRSYAKLGARVGWRIDFGRPGGFVFEPSLGYDHAIGFGDTFGKKLQEKVDGDIDISEVDEGFKILENFIFVGGPRLTLGFGWRF
jgi:hypothetical protein